MSAAILREAASLMRERAEAAPLETEWSRRSIDRQGTCDGCARGGQLVAAYTDYSGESEPWLCSECAAAADFDASWHPAVALAVADWLEATANDGEALGEAADMSINWEYGCLGNALAVARAYLGGESR